MNYFSEESRKKDECICVQNFLNSIHRNVNEMSYEYVSELIKFILVCIVKGFNMLSYKDLIFEILDNMWEDDNPIILNSLSIIQAYFDGHEFNWTDFHQDYT